MPAIKPTDFKDIYANFESAVSRYDCGKKCAPHNNGVPVCCSTDHAIPVVFYAEWQFLKSRSNLWSLYKPETAHEEKMRDELDDSCRLVECRGVEFCERENRSLSCRTFPFFPYITKEDEFIGLTHYWNFEDRCWVISNLEVVEKDFVREFVATYEKLFEHFPDERATYRDYSASMRRVFSRWKRKISMIHRDGGYYNVTPKTGALHKTAPTNFPKHDPYKES